MEKVKQERNKTPEEILIEQRISSGEEIEITEALDIIDMIKSNLTLQDISKKTGKSISKIEELKQIFKL